MGLGTGSDGNPRFLVHLWRILPKSYLEDSTGSVHVMLGHVANPIGMMAAALIVGIPARLAADSKDSVSLRFQVQEVVDLEMEEPRITFEVSQFDSVGSAHIRKDSTYRILANCDTPKRLIASLSAPIPSGTSLELQLHSPQTGVVSTGSQFLGVEPVELLTGLGKLNRSGVLLTYVFHAAISANVGSVSPAITFSVVP